MTRSPGSLAAEWVVFRDLMGAGRSPDAMALADRIVAESDDPARIAQALIEKLVGLVNIGQTAGVGPLLDQIVAKLRQDPVSRLVGEFHTMAGAVAYEHGSLAVAVTHLVHAERALRRMDETNLAATDAWHDLSVTYSLLGFHHKALEAMRIGRGVCSAAGLPMTMCVCIETLVRAAVARDQRGCTDTCVRDLQSVVHMGRDLVAELVPMERVFLRYAVHRLAALDQPVELEVPTDSEVDAGLAVVNHLASVCQAIAAGTPDLAIALLDAAPRAVDVFGVAEPLRLRSLALARLGDHSGALAAERAVLRAVTSQEQQLRDRFIESISARLDQERLRRLAAQHADAAYSDALTGLPNRRRLETFAAALSRRRVTAAVGELDLDGFKAVNDTHGHPSGDLVLQRIAGILAGLVRHSDLLARYGGDEFVLILPTTSIEEARDIGDRIVKAVAREDWEALVPGTPISASIGWAELAAGADLTSTLYAADKALYLAKRARLST